MVNQVPIDLTNIPRNIVRQIFCFACQPIYQDAEWRRNFCPLKLGQVSKGWRELAWSTPEVWETLVLRLRKNAYDVQGGLLEEWLARARGIPMDICFMAPADQDEYGRCTWELPDTIIEKLLRHSHQWRCIEFRLPLAFYKHFHSVQTPAGEKTREEEHILTLAPLTLPFLSSVSLHYSTSDTSQYRLPIPVNFRRWQAFDIRTVAFSSSKIDGRFFEKYPTQGITRMILTKMTHIDLWKITDRFPILEELELTKPRFLLLCEPRKAFHSYLNTLTVSFYTQRHFSDFFKTVAFSHLETLFISLPLMSFRYTECLVSFFEDSGCLLKSLRLECPIVAEDDLIDLLASLASLVKLVIYDTSPNIQRKSQHKTGLGRKFFETFNPDINISYLPNLEVFSYEGTLAAQKMTCIKPLVIRSFVRSPHWHTRLEDVATLTSATIQANCKSEISDVNSDRRWVIIADTLVNKGILNLTNTDGSKWKLH